MRILAVIPARAGSKGIPNKNIRIINGKPLIAYCIENALKSKFITDIVITTDSREVELVAEHYKVPYVHRRPELCEDNVTLDAVIYDACQKYEVDYVVTMQPTSPTLRSETLDDAIQYTIENDYDTVISVVNKPHLAWVEKDGKVVPAYKERVNRQYMAKYFLETGAFLIAKRSVVSERSRIGRNVSVFEVSDDEAIDIDDFQDFLAAENVISKKRIAIVVNGNNLIGMGHISRMMELADFFYEKPDFYYDSNITDERSFGGTTYSLFSFSTHKELFDMLERGKYQLVINDILDTSEEYIHGLKEFVPKVIDFEDAGAGANCADLVINALYSEKESTSKAFFGKDYYFIPKLFLLYEPIIVREKVQNVFICFGGADPQNYTERVLTIISDKKYYHINFVVVLGKAKKGCDDIIARYGKHNIKVLYDVKNMPELMNSCDVGITSMGRTCFELAYLGIPTLAIAQNEREERHTFVSQNNGFDVCRLGVQDSELLTRLDSLINSSQEERTSKHNKMLANDLQSGRERVRNLIRAV